MDKKSLDTLHVGATLFDMHDQLRLVGKENPLPIVEPHSIKNWVCFPAPGGVAFITGILERFNPRDYAVNKLLTVVSEPERDPETGLWTFHAAWSYDNRSFGLLTIEVHA